MPLNTEKKRPISGLVRHRLSKLERIYGNLPELVVPLEEEDGNMSPSESTYSGKTGFTNKFSQAPGNAKKVPSKKIQGIEAIYKAKVFKNRSKKLKKARF